MKGIGLQKISAVELQGETNPVSQARQIDLARAPLHQIDAQRSLLAVNGRDKVNGAVKKGAFCDCNLLLSTQDAAQGPLQLRAPHVGCTKYM